MRKRIVRGKKLRPPKPVSNTTPDPVPNTTPVPVPNTAPVPVPNTAPVPIPNTTPTPVPTPVPTDVTVTVSDTASLQAALLKCVGGEVIGLNPGKYTPSLWIKTVPNALTKPIVLTSATTEKAEISTLNINGMSNVTLRSLNFVYKNDGDDPTWTAPFNITKSNNIIVEDCHFVGDVGVNMPSPADEGMPIGKAMSFSYCENITFKRNVIKRFYRGITVGNTNNVTVIDNEVTDMSSDGFNFAACQGVLVENNWLHDFWRNVTSAAHPDMIQFWTNGTTVPNIDIVIRGNLLDMGTGTWTQSIFMRNEEVDTGRAGPEMFYRNVLIENNLIRNGHAHGITVGEVDGIIVRNNTLLQALPLTDGSVRQPKINMKATSLNVLIEKNVMYTDFRLDWTGNPLPPAFTVRDNFNVQRDNNTLANFSGNHYVDPTNMSGGLASMKVKADSPILTLGVGSNLAQ